MFHDITRGNNSVPGVAGFSAGAGYDLATGLGSVDASLLLNHWSDASATNFTLAANPSRVSVAQGGANTASLTLSSQGGFSAPITLSASGAPAGVTVTFAAAALPAGAPVTVPASGTLVTAIIAADPSTAAGTYTLTLTGAGGGLTRSAQVALTIVASTFTLTPGAASQSVVAGYSSQWLVSTAATSAFNSAIGLSVSGLPAGVTANFAPASIAAPGSGSSILTVAAGSSAMAGNYNLTVTGSRRRDADREGHAGGNRA